MIKIILKNKAELMEMPITGIKKIGDFSKSNTPSSLRQGFEDNDLKFLNSEKAIEKIKNVWLGSRHNLNLIFLSAEGSYLLGLSGNHKQFTKNQKEWLKAHIDTKKEKAAKAINLVILGNWGADKGPLTGWMIAHKLGHALTSELEFNDEGSFRSGLESAVDQKVRVEFFTRTRKTDYFGLNNAITSVILKGNKIGALGTFKSARESKLRLGEEWNEFLAQYILTGSVKLSRATASQLLLAEKTSNKFVIEFFKHKDEAEFPKYLQELLTLLEDVINGIFDEMLTSAVGQVYCD